MGSPQSADTGWETCKENVQPVKAGRKAVALAAVADSPAIGLKSQTADVEERQERFWQEVKAAEGSEDPLQAWLRFIKWVQETLCTAGNKAELQRVLEACTKSLGSSTRYKDDIRFLRVWIQYADCVADPSDIFLFLKDNGIGQDFALFYEACATFMELKGSFERADGVYQEGVNRGAKPLERLKQKHAAFQQRMARRIYRKAQEEQLGLVADAQEPSRAALQSLAGVAPSHQRSRGSTQQQQQPLLSVAGLQLGRAAQQQQQQQQRGLMSLPSVGGGSGPFGRMPPVGGTAAAAPLLLAIHTDEEFGAAGSGPALAALPPSLGHMSQLPRYGLGRKENESKPSVWTSARMPSANAGGTAAPTKLEVYEDDEFAQEEEQQQEEQKQPLRQLLERSGPSAAAPSAAPVGLSVSDILGCAAVPRPGAAAGSTRQQQQQQQAAPAKQQKPVAPQQQASAVPAVPQPVAGGAHGFNAALLVGADGAEQSFEEARALEWLAGAHDRQRRKAAEHEAQAAAAQEAVAREAAAKTAADAEARRMAEAVAAKAQRAAAAEAAAAQEAASKEAAAREAAAKEAADAEAQRIAEVAAAEAQHAAAAAAAAEEAAAQEAAAKAAADAEARRVAAVAAAEAQRAAAEEAAAQAAADAEARRVAEAVAAEARRAAAAAAAARQAAAEEAAAKEAAAAEAQCASANAAAERQAAAQEALAQAAIAAAATQAQQEALAGGAEALASAQHQTPTAATRPGAGSSSAAGSAAGAALTPGGAAMSSAGAALTPGGGPAFGSPLEEYGAQAGAGGSHLEGGSTPIAAVAATEQGAAAAVAEGPRAMPQSPCSVPAQSQPYSDLVLQPHPSPAPAFAVQARAHASAALVLQPHPSPAPAMALQEQAHASPALLLRPHPSLDPTVTISTRGAFAAINDMFSDDLPTSLRTMGPAHSPKRHSLPQQQQQRQEQQQQRWEGSVDEETAADAGQHSTAAAARALEPTMTIHTRDAFAAINDMFAEDLPTLSSGNQPQQNQQQQQRQQQQRQQYQQPAQQQQSAAFGGSRAVAAASQRAAAAEPTVTINTRDAFAAINGMFGEDLPTLPLRRPAQAPQQQQQRLQQLPGAGGGRAAHTAQHRGMPASSSLAEPTVTINTRDAYAAINGMFGEDLPTLPLCSSSQPLQRQPSAGDGRPAQHRYTASAKAVEPTVTINTRDAYAAINGMFADETGAVAAAAPGRAAALPEPTVTINTRAAFELMNGMFSDGPAGAGVQSASSSRAGVKVGRPSAAFINAHEGRTRHALQQPRSTNGMALYEDVQQEQQQQQQQSPGGIGVYEDTQFLNGANGLGVYEDTQFLTGRVGQAGQGGGGAGGSNANNAAFGMYEDTQFMTSGLAQGERGTGGHDAADGIGVYEDTQFMTDRLGRGGSSSGAGGADGGGIGVYEDTQFLTGRMGEAGRGGGNGSGGGGGDAAGAFGVYEDTEYITRPVARAAGLQQQGGQEQQGSDDGLGLYEDTDFLQQAAGYRQQQQGQQRQQGARRGGAAVGASRLGRSAAGSADDGMYQDTEFITGSYAAQGGRGGGDGAGAAAAEGRPLHADSTAQLRMGSKENMPMAAPVGAAESSSAGSPVRRGLKREASLPPGTPVATHAEAFDVMASPAVHAAGAGWAAQQQQLSPIGMRSPDMEGPKENYDERGRAAAMQAGHGARERLACGALQPLTAARAQELGVELDEGDGDADDRAGDIGSSAERGRGTGLHHVQQPRVLRSLFQEHE